MIDPGTIIFIFPVTDLYQLAINFNTMSSTGSYYLPYERYESCAREFVELSSKLGDGWELKTVKICSEPARVFLTKTTSHIIDLSSTNPLSTSEALLDLAGGASELDDIIDPAVAKHTGTQHTVNVEYHIVYSDSYEVPILYFNAMQLNGKQLALDDIWKIVSTTLTSTSTDRWSLISQQEHPLLCRPFYHVHPCHTAKVMGQALSITSGSRNTSCSNEHSNGVNYLISWLSVFGPLVGLSVSLAYNKPEE